MGIDITIEGYGDKKVYVWVDAVLGYLTLSKKWALDNDKDWKDFWGSEVIYYHIHGKDNIPFHIIKSECINTIYY